MNEKAVSTKRSRQRHAFPSRWGRKRGLRVYRLEPAVEHVCMWYKDLVRIYPNAAHSRNGRSYWGYGGTEHFFVSKEDLRLWAKRHELSLTIEGQWAYVEGSVT